MKVVKSHKFYLTITICIRFMAFMMSAYVNTVMQMFGNISLTFSIIYH